MYWYYVSQERDKCRALVNTVMNIWVPQNAWNFLNSWGPIAS